jgi:hypothetical protein
MPLDFDFTGVERKEGGDFEPLPEGDYILKIADAKEGKKEGGNHPYLMLTFECENVKIWEVLTYHPNSIWKIRQLLEAISGEPIEGAISMDEKDLIGAELKATLGVKNREDKPDIKKNYVIAYKMN